MNKTTFVYYIRLQAYSSALNLSIEAIIQLGVVLDKNATSHFSPNATVADIVRLFAIEDWNGNIDYELYYKNCNPVNCFYTITKNFHIPTVLTTIIGLMGGISVILKIILPPIVKLIRYRWRLHKENTRIVWQGKEQIERSILNEK